MSQDGDSAAKLPTKDQARRCAAPHPVRAHQVSKDAANFSSEVLRCQMHRNAGGMRIICLEEARVAQRSQLSTALMGMARSWTILANQMDRLQDMKDQSHCNERLPLQTRRTKVRDRT
jgi:hypothetical protein